VFESSFVSFLGKRQQKLSQCFKGLLKKKLFSQARVYEWFSRFKRGDMSLEDQPQCGHGSTSRTDENIKKICDAIMFDRRPTIDELEALTGIL